MSKEDATASASRLSDLIRMSLEKGANTLYTGWRHAVTEVYITRRRLLGIIPRKPLVTTHEMPILMYPYPIDYAVTIDAKGRVLVLQREGSPSGASSVRRYISHVEELDEEKSARLRNLLEHYL